MICCCIIYLYVKQISSKAPLAADFKEKSYPGKFMSSSLHVCVVVSYLRTGRAEEAEYGGRD